jgi:hypothetical protein
MRASVGSITFEWEAQYGNQQRAALGVARRRSYDQNSSHA